MSRWPDVRLRLLIRAAKVAGTAVRLVRGPGRALPGIAGAAAVTLGAAIVVHAVFRQVPAVGVAALVAGVFALLLGAEVNGTARRRPPRDLDE